jgi:pimeloyl-ACP methyl ester carboxylesterase
MRRPLVVVLLIALACGKSETPPPPPAPEARAAPPPVTISPIRAMRINETVLNFRLAGDTGSAVVFIHGSFGALDDWNSQVAAFARSHRVLVYSRRYHPPNPPQPDAQVYSPELHAADLFALLQALGFGPSHIVGAGYGGYVALALAAEHREMVRTLVLAEPPIVPFLWRTPAGDTLRRAFLANVLDPARAALARGDSIGALRLFLNGSGSAVNYDRLTPAGRSRVLSSLYEVRRELTADRQQYFPPLDCRRLGTLQMPVLLLQGDRSPRMYHIITSELANCLQSDTTITIPDAGHDIHTTNPGLYNGQVLRFVDTH